MMLKIPIMKSRIPAKYAQPLGEALPMPPVSICVRVAWVRGSVTPALLSHVVAQILASVADGSIGSPRG
jgi:hypothetical protein